MAKEKKICFVRHAKSSWAELGIPDLERPLNPRGIRDRVFMSQKFESDFFIPELLISSHAKRAYDTATSFAKAFNLKTSEIVVERKLYHADSDDFEELIFEQDDKVNSMMLFSHNPGLTHFANSFSEHDIVNVPTTGIFILESAEKSWLSFLRNCKLTSFIYPKLYA